MAGEFATKAQPRTRGLRSCGRALSELAVLPANSAPPEWVGPLIGVIALAEPTISTETTRTGLSSDDVLALLAPGLNKLGFEVEDGKGRLGKVRRPVLFGENGLPTVTYEVDAAHKEHGIVVEIEAGRGARGNAEYRDLVRTSLILDARFLVLAQPIAYRFKSGSREGIEHAYLNTVNLLEALYASQRLPLPFEGVLLVGY